MKAQMLDRLDALNGALDAIGRVAVAVSGGVDSLTLACVAHHRLGSAATMFHAVSPAVPPEATERTRAHAARFGWLLTVLDAGEFADPRYVDNPANRCFYCKSNLYGTIARHSDATIISGTNTDDLADFRPGLKAADNHGVRHPYVEAGIDKSQVRAIAQVLNLRDTAELPASPCLSSRLETGIRVSADRLALVHAVERMVSRELEPEIVRCRIRRDGLTVELDAAALARLDAASRSGLRGQIERLGASYGYPGKPRLACYRMGSAFLRD